jgi:hypothetical protein
MVNPLTGWVIARNVVTVDVSHSGGDPVTVKKILTWLFGLFVIFFLAFRPASAAVVVKWVGSGLATLANGMSDFVSHLTG